MSQKKIITKNNKLKIIMYILMLILFLLSLNIIVLAIPKYQVYLEKERIVKVNAKRRRMNEYKKQGPKGRLSYISESLK